MTRLMYTVKKYERLASEKAEKLLADSRTRVIQKAMQPAGHELKREGSSLPCPTSASLLSGKVSRRLPGRQAPRGGQDFTRRHPLTGLVWGREETWRQRQHNSF